MWTPTSSASLCADLTVNPILVEWNKSVAARLAPFPGLGLGLLETNGHQNYRHWERMRGYHPCRDASWATPVDGVFRLDEEFYRRSACLFEPSPHYEALFPPRGRARRPPRGGAVRPRQRP